MKNSLHAVHELSAEIKNLSEELRTASTHFHLFNALRTSVPKFKTEFGRAPLFWSFTRHAHLQAAVISVCRFYDQHRCDSNFPRLLENIQKNLLLFNRKQFEERNNQPGLEAHEGYLQKQCNEDGDMVAA
jgi:hypothetical protein